MTDLRILIASLVLGVSCGGEPAGSGGDFALDPDVPPVVDGAWYRPGAAVTWQWQLLGEIDTAYDVELYDVDLFDAGPAVAQLQADGRRVICYFSAGSGEAWREDFTRFRASDLGRPLSGFEDERWLDIRSENVWSIMMARLDRAVDLGCDGVEPDNVDGYTNDTGFSLTATDQLAFDRNLANEAHRRGLAVGLKNAGDQALELVAYFDFELNEQCHEFQECDQLAPFLEAGKPVLNVEYAADLTAATALAQTVCPLAGALGLRTLIMPLDLDDSFRVACF